MPIFCVNSGHRAPVKVSATASGGAAAAPAPAKQPFKWGANMKNLAICVGVGVALSLCPAPQGVTTKAWNLLAIFTGDCYNVVDAGSSVFMAHPKCHSGAACTQRRS
eukprot:GHUV01029525.1.p1 GENE.GHUV01029525.1~~GHUV01029525.1.p1  ORF type:complete len:107 (-),score=10.37 GHUV01029525.1:449-769(-)